MKLVHLITDLYIGGAEISLLKLLSKSNLKEFSIEVISLRKNGPVGNEIKNLGIPVIELGWNTGIPNPFKFLALIKLLHLKSPDILKTWMYHANLIGGLVAKLAGIPVIWSIHHDRLDPTLLKHRTIQIAKLGAWLSKFIPHTIVFCAESSKQEHIRIGYNAKKSVVIPNGFDTNLFRPNIEARQLIRKEFGIPYDALVVGHVGRFDPTKDHKSFILAAEKIVKRGNIFFILCGKGVDWKNKTLVGWIDQAGIKERTFLLGQRNDMPGIYATLDLFVSSSVSESFPNVIGEAMSSGVPCVVTDVGDSSIIIGETGLVVPPGDPMALADAAKIFLSNKDLRVKWGGKARERIMENYSLQRFVKKFEELFTNLLLEKQR